LRLMPQVLAQELADGDEVLRHLQRLMWLNGRALLAPQREEIDMQYNKPQRAPVRRIDSA
jgi:hypothetical protein